MKTTTGSTNRENAVTVKNGWVMLPANILMLLGSVGLFIYGVIQADSRNIGPASAAAIIVIAVLTFVSSLIVFSGFFTLQPNEARVLVLFGEYRGTVRESGFHWGNPFYTNGPSSLRALTEAGKSGDNQAVANAMKKHHSRNKISLRARNLNGEKLKVNDKRGNPIEIGAVVVWRVHDTAQAMFDVDDYENYVSIQSESALRHLANAYAYDNGEENEITLRSGVDEVSQALKRELEERLSKAGVAVEEARLTHLAYAPEIAQAMLRRQQAEAVIAARTKIVHGAVSMVEMALKDLADRKVLVLDDERKAAMVSNLLVVLCGESEVHPVVNTGTLYA
jgi:regulator of protease activity HflC (stomatin/prohibitin superfamily)